MLPLIFLTCNFLFSAVTASPSQLLARKSTGEDPYLICDGTPPLSSLPGNYLQAWYPNTLALCSALNGAARNVGCICHSSTGYVHCDQHTADIVLYSHRVPSSPIPRSRLQTLAEFCTDNCYCADRNSARAARTRNQATTTSNTRPPTATSTWPSIQRIQGVINVPYDPEGTGNPFASLAGTSYSISADATEMAVKGAGVGAPRNWWANQCGTNCTSNADCAGGGGNCTCLAAQKGTFEPGVGAMAFVAACVVSLAKSASGGGGVGGKPGGKRDLGGWPGAEEEGWGCPCNGSYVSRGCCGVRDGLVWEGEEFKLGELVR